MDLGNHYGTFILTSKYKTHSEKSNHLSIRDMSTFNVEIFLGDLNVNINEAELNNSMPVDDYREKFYNTFKKVVNNYAPLRKATRKGKQLHAKRRLTPALLYTAANLI